ncbi:SCP1.201-like deaminase [Saccharopolyspora kobensis]|uniref:SCP1.201-like deaminase n=1 Tax=Saccharopolyspora kobensis TaxID=146035 RepID=A0A1H6E102_9PSEU|nr:DddA-like double-stranded DNA deaminase toxin [Saccharopolyspora kobensis]SEG90676.1 SCP1.201-like deaminase [Saccharopolyspora kobensis]SFD93143.1 SCP1.201-like deaminase [Saccharopolyspora kobensis]
MASAVEQLGQAIATAVSKIEAAAGALTEAIDRCEEGNGHLATALQGATDDEVLAAAQVQQTVPQELAAVRQQVQAIATQLGAYRERNGIPSGAPPGTTAAPASPATSSAPSSSQPSAPARSELPRPPRAGKTHGRWINSNGDAVMLESGKGGEYYKAARQRAVELGLTYGRPNAEAAISRHVEVQFAMRMNDQNITDAEIEINRRVCGTTPGRDDDLPDTCDKWLERFLPPGSTLRVKDGSSPNGRLYRGKEGDR